MRNITGSNVNYTDAIADDRRTDKEIWCDNELSQFVPVIVNMLTADAVAKFQAEMDSEDNRFGRLSVMRVWQNRLLDAIGGLNSAIAARERAIKVNGSPGQRGYQLTSAVIKAQEAGIDCEIDHAGKVTVK